MTSRAAVVYAHKNETIDVITSKLLILGVREVPRPRRSHNHSNITHGKNCSHGVSTTVFVGYLGRAFYPFLLSPYSSAENVISDFSFFEVHIPGTFIVSNPVNILRTKTRSQTDSCTDITSICTVSFTLQKLLSIIFNTPTLIEMPGIQNLLVALAFLPFQMLTLQYFDFTLCHRLKSAKTGLHKSKSIQHICFVCLIVAELKCSREYLRDFYSVSFNERFCDILLADGQSTFQSS